MNSELFEIYPHGHVKVVKFDFSKQNKFGTILKDVKRPNNQKTI